jgi:hypothetical protein
VAVALFLLSAGLNTFTVPGCKTSMLDMAPAYSGRDITNTSGVIFVPGICWPPLSIPYTDQSYEKKLFSLSRFCKNLLHTFATIVGNKQENDENFRENKNLEKDP